jgi:hypothetical protein
VAGRLPNGIDAQQAAIASASFARSVWGDPANAPGNTVVMDNKSYTVIGVISGEHVFPEHVELWFTGAATPENLSHTAYNYFAIGRLQSGNSQAAAQQELNALSARLPGQTVPRQYNWRHCATKSLDPNGPRFFSSLAELPCFSA